MGLFNRLSGKQNSVNSIQFKMLLAMESLLDEVQKQGNVSQELQLPNISDYYNPEEPARIKELKKLGFNSVDEVARWEKQQKENLAKYNEEKKRVEDYNYSVKEQARKREKLIKTFKFFLEARNVYGQNTILLPINKFFEILDKYDLVCGTFSDYCGNIPEDKMQELHFLSEITQHAKGISTLYPVEEIITRDRNDSDFRRARNILIKFPFTLGNLDGGWRRNYGWQLIGDERVWSSGSWDWMIRTKTNDRGESISTKFFIAAPKEVMKSEIVVREITPVQKDPMIGLLADDYDSVLITARWGEEAGDKIIKKAEDINYRLDLLKLAILKGQL